MGEGGRLRGSSHNKGEEGHANEETESHLAEVRGPALVELREKQEVSLCPKVRSGKGTHVDFGIQLGVAGERVHNDAVRLGTREELVVDDVGVLDGLVLGEVLEPLLLDASHVQHVGAAEDAGETRRLEDRDARLDRLGLDALRHREGCGGDEVEGDRVEREEANEAVDGAAVLEVADHGDREAVDRAELFADRVDVEEGLERREKSATRFAQRDGQDQPEWGARRFRRQR